MCSYSIVKLHEAIQMFLMADYVRKMTKKKSFAHGEYGLFEHLLFLLKITLLMHMSKVQICVIFFCFSV